MADSKMNEQKRMTFKDKLLYIQQNLNVPKDNVNTDDGRKTYTFRRAEQILAGAKPLLSEMRVLLTLTDEIVCMGPRIYVKSTAELFDTESDEQVAVSALARETEEGTMAASQLTGSASSYARKYALGGLFLLDDNKDPDEGRNPVMKGNSPETCTTSGPEQKALVCISPADVKKPRTSADALSNALGRPENRKALEAAQDMPDEGSVPLATHEELLKVLHDLVDEKNIPAMIAFYKDRGFDIASVEDMSDELLLQAINAKRQSLVRKKTVHPELFR